MFMASPWRVAMSIASRQMTNCVVVASAQKSGDKVHVLSTISDESKSKLTGDVKADLERARMTPAEKDALAEKAQAALVAKSDAFKAEAAKYLQTSGVTVTGNAILANSPGESVASAIKADPAITRVYTIDYPKTTAALLKDAPDVSIANHINAEFVTYSPGTAAEKTPKKIMFIVQQEDLGNGQNGIALRFLKDTLKAGDEVFLYMTVLGMFCLAWLTLKR
jgi:hypothetical protein